MNLDIMLIVFMLALLAWVWLFFLWQRRAILSPPGQKALTDYPSLSVIRPIKGLDAGLEDNIRAGFEHGYPGPLETLFVFDDDQEPGVALVRKVMEERRQSGRSDDARILFSGQPPSNRTGKLNAMIVGLQASHHELIAFVDSDIRQDAEDLRILVTTLLSDERIGAAFPTVVSTATPRTLGDVGYALMINGLYEPAALATARQSDDTLPFIMGHMMVLRREAIQAMGGLEDVEGQLVDDMYIGRRFNDVGYLNKLSPKAAAIIQQDSSVEEFVGILIRWIAFSMSGLPFWSTKLPHWLSGTALWVGLLVAPVALIQGDLLTGGLALLLPLSVMVTMNRLHFLMAGAPIPLKYFWGSLLIWLSAPLIYGQIWFKREVNWRGRRYRLNLRSTLG